MSTITVNLRGLSGTKTITVESESDSVSVADIREAAGLAENLVLRINGTTVRDETDAVADGSTLVAAAPEAKHGFVS